MAKESILSENELSRWKRYNRCQKIDVSKMNFKKLKIRITGTSPLIVCKWKCSRPGCGTTH